MKQKTTTEKKAMSYLQFKNSLHYVLGALTDEFINTRYFHYKKGDLFEAHPELKKFKFLFND